MTETDILLQTIEASNATIASLSDTIKRQQEAQEKRDADHKKEVEGLEEQIRKLTAQVAYLTRQLFGRKSEKLHPYDPNYPDLFADLLPENRQEVEEAYNEAVEKVDEAPAEGRKQKRQMRKMQEDLPVLKTTIIEPHGIDKTKYKKIGDERTLVTHFKPGMLYNEEIIRIKYGLIDNVALPESGKSGVLIAPLPLLPIYKGIAGSTLLCEILLQKYGYHMPFYRQIKQFEHLGMKGLKENTIDGWFKQVMELLRPLYEALKEEVFKTEYAQADETTTPVIDHQRKKAAKEYLWMVRAVVERLVLFYYEEGSRAGWVIQELAKNLKGYLQCDGYVGYETAFRVNPDVRIVNCMAHIRRKFEAALSENKEVADRFLGDIQRLYRIERACDEAGCTPEQRKAKRQELAKPIMDSLKMWMETEGIKYSESSLTGTAVTYAYTRWDNMMHYLEDGRIRIDNNLAENEIRPITLGRKNYLFCGNHEAARNMTVICSLLATCKAHDVNPREYLGDVIARMPYMQNASHEELVELLPHKWKPLTVNPYPKEWGVLTTTDNTPQ